MRTAIFLLFFNTLLNHLVAQVALTTRIPNVTVKIELVDQTFSTIDSVKFLMTVTSNADTLQKILFNKPVTKIYPWGTSAAVNNSSGKSMIEFPSRELLSSQVYTKDQIEKLNIYSTLAPKQSVTSSYYLIDIAVFNTSDGKLPKGKYSLQVGYHFNLSNKVNFIIE